jgi:signal transduction histidine kinase/ActR/RegA family two-component response regulator
VQCWILQWSGISIRTQTAGRNPLPERQIAYEQNRAVTMADLVEPAFHVEPDDLVRDIKRRMASKQDPIHSAVVVAGQTPVGLIMSLHLDRVLSQQYGVALYHKKHVAEVMDSAPFVAEADQPLELVAEEAMKRDRDKLFDHVVVTHQGLIQGIVTVENMLSTLAGLHHRRTLEMQEINKKLQLAHHKTENMNRELSEAYVKLREVDQLKTDFLSIVSHELRTPLTSVLGFAEITQADLRNVIFPQLYTEDRKVLRAVKNVENNIEIIFKEGERLTSLINDVLDIAKMEAGKVDWKTDLLDMTEIVRRSLASTASLFRKKQLEQVLEFQDDLPRVVGDGERLMQVMVNLISNAVKFTDHGSVTCRVAREDTGLRVSVLDTGTGIAAQDTLKIFEKFKQVGDTLTEKPAGTGLGLPICKQIIEHHKGRIGVNSIAGQGSEFWFILPGAATVDNSVNQTAATFLSAHGQSCFQLLAKRLGLDNGSAPKPGEPRSGVLLISQEERLLHHLGQHCETLGLAPHKTSSIADALTASKRLPLACVILDLNDHDNRLLDMAAVLRKQRRTQDIIVMGLCRGDTQGQKIAMTLDRLFIRPVIRSELLKECRLLATESIRLERREPAASRQLLVADDDTAIVDSLAGLLRKQGYAVDRASNTDDCMDMALKKRPAIVVTGARFAARHDLLRILRFEKGLDTVRAVLLA